MLAFRVADILDGQWERPKRRGRPPEKARNRLIVEVIEKLEGVGVDPMATAHYSGVDVVAKAFRMKRKTVETVWQDYKNWRDGKDITDAEWEWLGFPILNKSENRSG